jgi:hypothetical protein
MNEALILGLLSALVAVLLAVLGYIVALLISLNRRIRSLERRDRLNWLYIQSLIAHAYKHLATPLPNPPEGWVEIIE